MSNYYIGSDGNLHSEDELKHWGIKGMKWGVRRYQNADGTLTPAGKKRRYATDLGGRKQSLLDNPEKRKQQVATAKREADDRVKFYDSKHAAKRAIEDEASYVKRQNRGKAFLDTVTWGGAGGVLGAAALAGTAAGGVVGLAVPLAVAATVSSVRAAVANRPLISTLVTRLPILTKVSTAPLLRPLRRRLNKGQLADTNSEQRR